METDLHDRLRTFRTAWDRGGLDAVRALAPSDGEPLGVGATTSTGAQDVVYEFLGYDAIAADRLGWAYVCLQAAAEQHDLAGAANEVARLRQVGREVLRQGFPPYDDDASALSDIREWARARARDVAEGAVRRTPLDPTTALEHRWTLRLLRTREDGRRLRFDDLVDRFGLSAEDRVLLRVLVALDGEPGTDAPTVGRVLDLVSTDPRGRAAWASRFDARHPLLRWGLVVVDERGGTLRRRRVEPAESVLAWMDARDHWPLALRDVAALGVTVDRRTPPWLERTIARLDRVRDRARRLGTGALVTLRSASPEACRAVAESWAGGRGVPWIEVSATRLDPAPLRDLARESRLRGACIVVPRWPERDVGALAGLAVLAAAPVLVGGAPPSVVASGGAPAVAIDVPAPPRDVRAGLWNDALVARGLAELSPAALDETIGAWALFPAEMTRVVARAADQAWIDREEDGPIRVGVDALRALVSGDPDLGTRRD